MKKQIEWWDDFARELVPPEVEFWTIRSLLGEIKDKCLVDLGCGNGEHVRRYSAEGARVVGVDLSPGMLEVAREKNPNSDFVLADVTKLPFKDETFDKAYSYFCYCYVPWWKQKQAFKEVHRVVKERFVFHTVQMDYYWARQWWLRYRYWGKNRYDPNFRTFPLLSFGVLKMFRKVYLAYDRSILPAPGTHPIIVVCKK